MLKTYYDGGVLTRFDSLRKMSSHRIVRHAQAQARLVSVGAKGGKGMRGAGAWVNLGDFWTAIGSC